METTTPTENMAAVLHGAGVLKLEPFPLKTVGSKDVLLAMGAVGICGSDLKYWKYGVCGRFTLIYPMVIGHEGSGTDVKVRRDVTNLKPGHVLDLQCPCFPPDVLLAMGAVGICGSDLKYWKYGVCGRFTLTSPMVIGHEGSGTVIRMGRDVTDLKPDVLLAMGAVGICGSDLKYWKYGVCGRFTLTSPMVIGHEGSGTVVTVGRDVTNLKPGDRVAVEPGVPCRMCHLCRSGRYNVCPKVAFCATPPVDGNLAQHYVHPADFCFKLPDHVTLEEGALCEPLAVSVYACQRGDVGLGNTVFICGAGPVGLMTMMVAKVKGASKVIMSDIDDGRLKVAKEMGADYTINVRSKSPKEIAELVETTLGAKADCSLECSGSDVSMNACIYATESGGSVVLVGRGSITPEVALVEAASREVDLKGVFRYANCYPAALSLLAQGLVDVKPLVSHRFGFIDSKKAFETAYDRTSGAMKVVINCQQ